MGLFSNKAPVEEQVAADPTGTPTYDEKTAGEHPGDRSSDDEPIGKDLQAGVAKVEAMTAVWTKRDLIIAYTLIWLFYVVTSIQEVSMRVLSPFVTSSFAMHSLTATTSVMSTLIAGLIKLPLAKILDTWGRPQGLSIMLVCWILGFIMMAACKGVETYAAAQVFYSVGSQGISYCITIFIADTSTLKSRALMLSFATTPYIFTTWAAGPITDSILSKGGIGWRWGLGLWSIVAPVVIGPLILLFLWNQHKAKKMGIIDGRGSIKNISGAKILKFLIDVDALGILILAAGMALFLLPFNIYSYQSDGWRSPMIIAFIVVGFVLIIGFVVYEKYFAPVTFIPFALLMDRTVFFGGLMFVFVFFNSAVWGSFFTSMLMVVWNTSTSETTYISNIYRTGSCFFSIIISWLIYRTGRFKPFALFFCIPLMMLGVGLMIHFRQPDQPIGYIIMTQIFVAFAGGPTTICGEMAMLSPSDHAHVAVIMAILDLFGSVGSTVGYTVATAIWTGTFKKNIAKYTPAGTPVDTIYGDIYQQLSYAVGTPERIGIQRAYGDSQRIMLITSLCLLVGALGSVAMWRNINVKKIKQVRGNVV
ncbi:major facilitator superfamily transporter [Colletotrichum orchidophilum]|uniref:Major facilitator superfamily transporter n=1 Tax=Colletotrichum orchidophilum TaxID=1209926 RepID=A0A1G4AP02_9PEZI|nr:major facilitator superfamily transporter [Colletotrichum orchidophilum]OHE90783.1 major facilitator superfamily transporter [Colletotrichum orchidophilum]